MNEREKPVAQEVPAEQRVLTAEEIAYKATTHECGWAEYHINALVASKIAEAIAQPASAAKPQCKVKLSAYGPIYENAVNEIESLPRDKEFGNAAAGIICGVMLKMHRFLSAMDKEDVEEIPAAKPPEDGLEAQREKIQQIIDERCEHENSADHDGCCLVCLEIANKVLDLTTARERELREKLEVLADDWKARGKGGSEAELRSLLASHWPAKKESK
ncbi:MAG: hypothetical protein WCC95_18180 [Candidatus Sulfotelmatobacter sp.]